MHSKSLQAALAAGKTLTCRSLVSLLSLKGMCTALPSDSLAMTVPRVSRLLLMKDPSWRWLLLREARADSEPAGPLCSSQSAESGGCPWVAFGRASGLMCANKVADAPAEYGCC